MGGICGFTGAAAPGLIQSMTETLLHRGPDDVGYFEGDDIALGMRRLSIIDVAGGHQPITSEDGSLVIVFNGEIYNYADLREPLVARGHRFKTKSDTEVILHWYQEEGPASLQRLNGIFAFAIWDRKRRRLFLARDRLGVKPLYYTTAGNRFAFGSEYKAILQLPHFEPTLDLGAVHDYLALRYAGPASLIREIKKLPAGHYLLLEDDKLTVGRYWRPELFGGPFPGSEEEYLEGLAHHFERSVRMQLVSEVPVGAYLSGGVDSGTIVAVMSKLTGHPVRTFTVGFDFEHDELAQAARIAHSVGAQHTEFRCLPEHVELLPDVAYHLDDPVGDPIVLPMFMLSREAKRQVTVVLSGEGADEVWGGYLFHWALLRAAQAGRVVPRIARRAVVEPLLRLVPHGVLNLWFDYPAALGKRGKTKLIDFVDLADPDHLPAAYRHLISLFDPRDTAALYSERLERAAALSNGAGPGTGPLLNRIIDLQFDHWLSEDILTKQDKMSMAHSIEARVPFLDHELVEFGLRVPPRLKIRGRERKYLLRRYAARVAPAASSQPKRPFYVPLEGFFRHPRFRDILDDTLSDATVRSRGLFLPDGVAALRDSVRHGEFVHAKQVFSLVMLELWFRMALDRKARR